METNYQQEMYVKHLLEENESLRTQLEEAKAGWQQCAKNWEEAVAANKNLITELAEVRNSWKESAQNWIASVKVNEELHEKLEKMVAEKELIGEENE